MASYVLRKKEINEILSQSPVQGKRMLLPALPERPIGILEDSNVSNDAEIHKNDWDLWICLEGEADFIVGGEMAGERQVKNKDGTINENEIKAKDILGGEKITVRKGDVLWVPPGTPHKHGSASTARFFIVKVPKKQA